MQGLNVVREQGCTDTSPGCGYNDNCEDTDSITRKWSCGRDRAGKWRKYFGRGAKQLSYNFNYGQFSQAMFDDRRLLLDHPDFVADTWLNLASATWFYTTPQPPKPSMLHVIDGTWLPNEQVTVADLFENEVSFNAKRLKFDMHCIVKEWTNLWS